MIVKRYPADYFSQFSIISTLYVWGFKGKKENTMSICFKVTPAPSF